MQHKIIHQGAFPMVHVELAQGETIKAESGAMIAMSPTIDVAGKADGGILKGIGRMLAGETFFFQTLTATRGPGQVMFAHSIPGEIAAIPLDGRTTYSLQKNGFLAGSSGLDVSTKMQNLTKGLFSGEGFFVVKVSGTGTLFVSTYGAIHPIDLAAGEEFIIDNSHLVAWPETMTYTMEKAAKAGWISSMTSGEGLVCRFKGPGRVLIQTRNPSGFSDWIKSMIPAR
jgi:uncharacterized protein (TIGR00266 family)